MAEGQQGGGNFICELCDKTTDVNWRCMECCQNMCNHCNIIHSRTKPAVNHHVVDIDLWDKYRVEVQCPNHDGYELNLYCVECNKLECESCMKTERKKQQAATESKNTPKAEKETVESVAECFDRNMQELKRKLLSPPEEKHTLYLHEEPIDSLDQTETGKVKTVVEEENTNGSKKLSFTRTYRFRMENGKLETVSSTNHTDKEYHSIISEEDYKKRFDELTKRVKMHEAEQEKERLREFTEMNTKLSPGDINLAALEDLISRLNNNT